MAPSVQAGKGAYVRIFNLSDQKLQLETDLSGFKDEGSKKSELKGQINPKALFPAGGPVYIEESNVLWDSDMRLKFTSAFGNPNIQITYGLKRPYYESEQNNNGGLFVYSGITQNNTAIDKGSSQAVINIFVSEHNVNRENWMSEIRDDAKLSQLFIPGSHDAATGELLISVPHLATQSIGYTNQLRSGVRYFDLRLAIGAMTIISDSYPPEMHHGIFPLRHDFKEPVNDTIKFLRKNPSETVIFQLKWDFGECLPNLQKVLKDNSNWFYTGTDIPTLGEVRGKIVIVSRIDNIGINFWSGWPGGNTYFTAQDEFERDSGKSESVDDFEKRKIKLVREYFANTCKFDPGTPAIGADQKFNLNFLSATFGAKFPLEVATGFSGRGDSLNVIYAKGLNSLSSLPGYHAVMLMDGVVKEDGLAQTALQLNFHTYGRPGFKPKAGKTYFFRPLIAPGKVLNVDVGKKDDATIHSQHPDNDTWRWQHFTLEGVTGQANTFRIFTSGKNGQKLYLDAFKGTESQDVKGISGGDQNNQVWKILQEAGSRYYRIQSAVDGKYLDVFAGKTKDGSSVSRYPGGGTLAHQLWLLEETTP